MIKKYIVFIMPLFLLLLMSCSQNEPVLNFNDTSAQSSVDTSTELNSDVIDTDDPDIVVSNEQPQTVSSNVEVIESSIEESAEESVEESAVSSQEEFVYKGVLKLPAENIKFYSISQKTSKRHHKFVANPAPYKEKATEFVELLNSCELKHHDHKKTCVQEIVSSGNYYTVAIVYEDGTVIKLGVKDGIKQCIELKSSGDYYELCRELRDYISNELKYFGSVVVVE